MAYLTSQRLQVALVCRTDECPKEGHFQYVAAERFTGRLFVDEDPHCEGCGEIRETVE